MKLVECIPNFSEGRDQEKINAIAAAGQSVPGVTLLDLQSDETHNRCVLTLVGSPDGMEEACVRMAKAAAELIDMRSHKGAHPRMGAVDVIPFVPAMDMSMEECVALSKRTAARIWAISPSGTAGSMARWSTRRRRSTMWRCSTWTA